MAPPKPLLYPPLEIEKRLLSTYIIGEATAHLRNGEPNGFESGEDRKAKESGEKQETERLGFLVAFGSSRFDGGGGAEGEPVAAARARCLSLPGKAFAGGVGPSWLEPCTSATVLMTPLESAAVWLL